MSPSSESETAVRPRSRANQNISLAELIRLPWVMELLLAAGTFLLFCGTLAFKFVYDDRMQILALFSLQLHPTQTFAKHPVQGCGLFRLRQGPPANVLLVT